MKRFLMILAAVAISAGFASAQTLEEATELYNSGATMLNSGDNESALGYFEQALTMGETIGADAAELVSNCQNIIPKIHLAIAKDLAAAKDTDKAVAAAEKAAQLGELYGVIDTKEEAEDLIPQILLQNAGNLLNAKDYAAAAEAYAKVTAIDPGNAVAWLRMGMAYGACGQTDKAVEAYKKASELGQAQAAGKQLSNLYLRAAVAAQKAKDYAAVLENAELSASYLNNANAQKLIGTAASALKQNEKAIAGFEGYLALSPNAKDKNQIYYQLATVYQAMGNNSQACTYYRQIVSDPNFGEYANHMIKNVLKCE